MATGKIVALLGANGAGKTSLMRVIVLAQFADRDIAQSVDKSEYCP